MSPSPVNLEFTTNIEHRPTVRPPPNIWIRISLDLELNTFILPSSSSFPPCLISHRNTANTKMDPAQSETDLHSFIQSGMGIALPALSMDPHQDPEEESFSVGHFGELMRDAAATGKEGEGEKRSRDEDPEEETNKRPREEESQQPIPQQEPMQMGPATGRPETAEERKARQREANRLAAGRSRGKKRDEL